MKWFGVKIRLFQFYFLFFNIFFVRYYHNITSNTLLVLESMAKYGVKTLIYSSTCATYGEPEKMPIIEITEQVGNLSVVKLWSLVTNSLFSIGSCYGFNIQWNVVLILMFFNSRNQLIHTEKPRRWQKISSLIFPKILRWQ